MKRQVDNYLVEKALNGDTEAFSAVYFLLRGSIYGFAYRMLRETSLAEDITQETFIFLLENPDKFDRRRGDIFPFLCGVARNKILHYLRKHSTRYELPGEDLNNFDNIETAENNQLDVLLHEELVGKIEEEIAELPAVYREVLILREFEELAYSEIAGIIEMELGQVKIRLHRARKMLAKKLKPYLIGNEEKYYEVC